MRWMPRPSLRTAIGLLALGIGLGAIQLRRFA
jgi:uncharacterized membrane protein YidH (DUF202 family)